MRVPAPLKNVLVVLSALLLLGYLFLTRGLWLSELERQAKVGKDRLEAGRGYARGTKRGGTTDS